MLNFDIAPYTLVLLVFAVLFLKQIVGKVGKNSIQDFGWNVYTKIAPKLGNKQFVELSSMKKELFRVSKEKKLISAQDEYARWTKLNRQVDKLNSDIAKKQEELTNNKVGVNRLISLLLTVTTTLPVWFFRVWFRKAVLFYLPTGVFPYYIEWCLALPFIQVGGIGLTVWMFATNNVISSILSIISFCREEPKAKPVQPKSEKTTETSIKFKDI